MTTEKPTDVDGWQVLTDDEAAVVEAITDRIIPSEDDSPGAHEARVVRFIDGALADAAAGLLPVYRNGVRLIETLARGRGGVGFCDLDAGGQDDVLSAIDERDLDDLAVTEHDQLQGFFATVQEHTVQGMFGDPEYGGNADGVGWKLVGFPGVQWGYSNEQMHPDFDSTTIPIVTLADLRRRLANGEVGGGGHVGVRS